ncbi:hypothetical protein BKA70DRAFT_1220670 [Coprinopsis sp. MPI-PUGE-AT-0042]|nr:hypothetical protein BKA70DRAFT_1220670 [Coprinopsis sp. MPI-PUGE-AT-0042]
MPHRAAHWSESSFNTSPSAIRVDWRERFNLLSAIQTHPWPLLDEVPPIPQDISAINENALREPKYEAKSRIVTFTETANQLVAFLALLAAMTVFPFAPTHPLFPVAFACETRATVPSRAYSSEEAVHGSWGMSKETNTALSRDATSPSSISQGNRLPAPSIWSMPTLWPTSALARHSHYSSRTCTTHTALRFSSAPTPIFKSCWPHVLDFRPPQQSSEQHLSNPHCQWPVANASSRIRMESWSLTPRWELRDGEKDAGWAEAVLFEHLVYAVIMALTFNSMMATPPSNGFGDCVHATYVRSKQNPVDGPSHAEYHSPTSQLLLPIPIPAGLDRFIVDSTASVTPFELECRKKRRRPPAPPKPGYRSSPIAEGAVSSADCAGDNTSDFLVLQDTDQLVQAS